MSTLNNPVGWFEIYVQDMARAKAFYEKVFGVTLTQLGDGSFGEMWAFPMMPEGTGASGSLVKMDGVTPGGGGTLVYFSCEDCAVHAQRALSAGGSIHQPKMSINEYGFISLVVDTEGNMIGLHSMS